MGACLVPRLSSSIALLSEFRLWINPSFFLLEYLIFQFSSPNFFFIRLICFGLVGGLSFCSIGGTLPLLGFSWYGRVLFWIIPPLYNPMTLSLKALNALLALSLMVLGTWLTNQPCQSLSSLVTCDLLLRISCRSNKSTSCELGCLSLCCLSNSGCLGLSGLNMID